MIKTNVMKTLDYYKQNTLLSRFQYEHLNIKYIIPHKDAFSNTRQDELLIQ